MRAQHQSDSLRNTLILKQTDGAPGGLWCAQVGSRTPKPHTMPDPTRARHSLPATLPQPLLRRSPLTSTHPPSLLRAHSANLMTDQPTA